MITLSYSSLNLLHECPHNWLNKMMGIPQEDKKFFQEGRESHRIIQEHVSGKKIDERLKHIEYKFPIVEKVDFDPDCKFSFKFGVRSTHEEYDLIGFFDGANIEESRILEIKTSSSPWSISKYMNSVQRKIEALATTGFKESCLITGSRNPDDWKGDPPKVYMLPFTESDRKEAMEWVMEGIYILSSGDFTTDLVDGKCVDPRCYWGSSCQFK